MSAHYEDMFGTWPLRERTQARGDFDRYFALLVEGDCPLGHGRLTVMEGDSMLSGSRRSALCPRCAMHYQVATTQEGKRIVSWPCFNPNHPKAYHRTPTIVVVEESSEKTSDF